MRFYEKVFYGFHMNVSR